LQRTEAEVAIVHNMVVGEIGSSERFMCRKKPRLRMKARLRRGTVFDPIERARETHASGISKHLMHKWSV
jgi:hypothetical protein